MSGVATFRACFAIGKLCACVRACVRVYVKILMCRHSITLFLKHTHTHTHTHTASAEGSALGLFKYAGLKSKEKTKEVPSLKLWRYLQWNLSVVDSAGAKKMCPDALISEVDLYTRAYHWDLRNCPD